MSTCRVNGEVRASGTTSEDFAAKLVAIARQLEAVDKRLRADDSVEISIAPL